MILSLDHTANQAISWRGVTSGEEKLPKGKFTRKPLGTKYKMPNILYNSLSKLVAVSYKQINLKENYLTFNKQLYTHKTYIREYVAGQTYQFIINV